MNSLPNWLLISGNGRNVGKTTLICRIISDIRDLKPIAVKISSHLHPLPEDSDWIIRTNEFALIRETRITSKDSSKMLQAGADMVFYAQGSELRFPDILAALNKFTSDSPVICESGGLRKLFKPGAYILVKGDEKSAKPDAERMEKLADLVLSQEDIITYKYDKKIHFENNNWLINS